LGLSSQSRSKFPFTLTYLFLAVVEFSCIVSAGTRSSGSASLEGSVMDSRTGEPVRKVIVELISEDSEEVKVFTSTTSPEGRFSFDTLLPGRYRVFAERTGFIEVNQKGRETGQVAISLATGQQLKGLSLYMLPAAVVTGHVVDEDGDPLADAEVAVWHPVYSPLGVRWENSAVQRTNDLGQYRISGLPPGKYLFSAMPPTTILNFATELKDPGASPKVSSAYVTTYYPNVHEQSQATAIEVHAGDDLALDFSLTQVATAEISGTVANLALGAKALVNLHPQDYEGYLTQVEVDPNGRFNIKKVPPGSYTLLATVTVGSSIQVARRGVEVSGSNISGIHLVPLPGTLVQGRIRFEDGRAFDPAKLSLQLQSGDGDDELIALSRSLNDSGRVRADGSFAWRDVPAAIYYLQVQSSSATDAGWFVKSVSAGGQDLKETGIALSGGSLYLDVVLSGKAAIIEGNAVTATQELVPNATIVAVPDAEHRKRQDRYVQTVADQRGRFRLRGLAPGQYTVFAFQDLDGDQFYDPEFLKAHDGGGKTLLLGEGDRQSLTVITSQRTSESANAAPQ
jgi:protocatechuate 3,4-dioxygenase beta subunit